jgi:hypothetical protein
MRELKKVIDLDVPLFCMFCHRGLENSGGWTDVAGVEIGCEVIGCEVKNEDGVLVAGIAVFTDATVVVVLKTKGCEVDFGGVDCGVNEKLLLLFENGFAVLAAVVGESTFG